MTSDQVDSPLQWFILGQLVDDLETDPVVPTQIPESIRVLAVVTVEVSRIVQSPADWIQLDLWCRVAKKLKLE